MTRIFKLLTLTALLICGSLCFSTAQAQSPYKNAVKLTFLSWISGSTKVSYERALPACKQSSEICASLICAGYDKYHNDPLGFTLRYGHKFFVAGYDSNRPLMGFYLRPEAIYVHYDYTHSVTGERTPSRMGSLLGTFGYQLCIKRFIADAWVGAGYCFGTPAETGYQHGFQLLKWQGKSCENVALSFSIRLGVLW